MNHNPIEQFREAIRSHGLIPPSVIEADGSLHRFPSNGKKGDEAGCYVLHLDGIPAGWIGDWRTGISQNWRANLGRNLTPTEEAEHRAKIETIKRERKAEEEKRQAEAREKASLIWSEAKPCSNHPYLTSKGIESHGARLYKDSLVIPVLEGGVLHSLQFINKDGDKKFQSGGRVQGCYFSIGNPKNTEVLCIVEGYATGATVHEATGYPVVVAFNAGNLTPTAKTIRAKFPELTIYVCADDDHKTDGNPGITKANEAALAANGVLVTPNFESDRPEWATDFNDLQKLHGTDAVRLSLTSASEKGKAEHQQSEYKRTIRAVDVHELATMQFKARDSLLEPWLHSQDLCMVFAGRGIGKTHFSLAVAYTVATGSKFLDWQATQARKVLYLDGELPGNVMQTRLLMHLPEQEPQPEYLRIFTPDLLSIDDLMPDLATPQGQEIINTMIEPDTALVVVDNLSAWARGTRAENDAESWLPIASWVLALRRRGIAVMLVHHAGKTGDQRGTSKREDLLDVVIRLKRPTDYDPKQGARFEMTFTKARNLYGTDAEGLEVTLLEDSNGSASWSWNTLESSTYQRVIDLANEELSQADIARELDVNRSTVNRHYRRATGEGLITKSKKEVI